jgi:hypothetical protein
MAKERVEQIIVQGSVVEAMLIATTTSSIGLGIRGIAHQSSRSVLDLPVPTKIESL